MSENDNYSFDLSMISIDQPTGISLVLKLIFKGYLSNTRNSRTIYLPEYSTDNDV